MARRDVVEVTCDRCGRVETQLSTDAKKPEGTTYEVEVTFQGETVKFEDLCRRCRDAVKGYFTRLTKKAEDDKPKEGSNVTPLDPAGDTTPKKRSFLGGK